MEKILFIIFTNKDGCGDAFDKLGICSFCSSGKEIAVIEKDLNVYCTNQIITEDIDYEKASILIIADIDIQAFKKKINAYIESKNAFYIVYHLSSKTWASQKQILTHCNEEKYKSHCFCSHICKGTDINNESVFNNELYEIAQAKNCNNDITRFDEVKRKLLERFNKIYDHATLMNLFIKFKILETKRQERIISEKEFESGLIKIIEDKQIGLFISQPDARQKMEEFLKDAVEKNDFTKELITHIFQ